MGICQLVWELGAGSSSGGAASCLYVLLGGVLLPAWGWRACHFEESTGSFLGESCREQPRPSTLRPQASLPLPTLRPPSNPNQACGNCPHPYWDSRCHLCSLRPAASSQQLSALLAPQQMRATGLQNLLQLKAASTTCPTATTSSHQTCCHPCPVRATGPTATTKSCQQTPDDQTGYETQHCCDPTPLDTLTCQTQPGAPNPAPLEDRNYLRDPAQLDAPDSQPVPQPNSPDLALDCWTIKMGR